jgi:hypothetical protein
MFGIVGYRSPPNFVLSALYKCSYPLKGFVFLIVHNFQLIDFEPAQGGLIDLEVDFKSTGRMRSGFRTV